MIAAAVLTLALAVVVLLKGKVWTGLVGMFITPLLVVGAIRLSRPHAPVGALALHQPAPQDAPGAGTGALAAAAGSPGQAVAAGRHRRRCRKFPDDAKVDEQLDREIHAAPAPKDRSIAAEPEKEPA